MNIFKSAHWPWRRCRFTGFFILSSAGHFVKRSGTIIAILLEGHRKNISVNHLAILVEGLPRNIPVNVFGNRSIGPEGNAVLRVFSIFSSDDHFVLRSGTI